MEHRPSSERLLSHPSPKLRLLYEPLVLLSSLGEVRGDRMNAIDLINENDAFGISRSRRRLVDAIAYICAYKKESAYVTAVALEKKPEEITVWVATNSGVDRAVEEFLAIVLDVIRLVVENVTMRLSDSACKQVKAFLTTKVLQFNREKIFAYYESVMEKAAPRLIEKLKGEEQNLMNEPDVARLLQWISINLSSSGAQLQPKDMADLALRCFDDRRVFDVLRDLAGNSRLTEASEKLHKLLRKIAKHVVACNQLIEATTILRSELSLPLRVDTVPPSEERALPLPAKSCTIGGISSRMFSDSSKKAAFLARLKTIYQENELNNVLAHGGKKRSTRVHAELLMLEHFERTGGEFLYNGDKYIGCSKPACYLCHLYISLHPGGYARPASHQKLYMGWRLPDIGGKETDAGIRFEDQGEILRKMTESIRSDLNNDINTRIGRLRSHPDSTAGGTSAIYPVEPGLSGAMGHMTIGQLRKILDEEFRISALPMTQPETQSETAHL